jgi:multiple antibiotic resistance protein
MPTLLDILVILLVTTGPTKAMVLFAKVTQGYSPHEKREVAVRAVLVSAIVLLVFVFLGRPILHIFHITLAALKLAGGLILLQFALHMISTTEEKQEEVLTGQSKLYVAVYPLAMPLMATPQGIVVVVTLAAGAQNFTRVLEIAGLVIAVMLWNLVNLLFADKILGYIGAAALQVIARVIGLLLVALAIQLMIWGSIDLGLLPPSAMRDQVPAGVTHGGGNR